jgi:hypothetical protein
MLSKYVNINHKNRTKIAFFGHCNGLWSDNIDDLNHNYLVESLLDLNN